VLMVRVLGSVEDERTFSAVRHYTYLQRNTRSRIQVQREHPGIPSQHPLGSGWMPAPDVELLTELRFSYLNKLWDKQPQ
jgi:hypothetical protein